MIIYLCKSGAISYRSTIKDLPSLKSVGVKVCSYNEKRNPEIEQRLLGALAAADMDGELDNSTDYLT